MRAEKQVWDVYFAVRVSVTADSPADVREQILASDELSKKQKKLLESSEIMGVYLSDTIVQFSICADSDRTTQDILSGPFVDGRGGRW